MVSASPKWLGNFVANVLGRTSSVLVIFIVTPFLVRLLGIEGYALVGVFLALMGITFILDFALGATMTRTIAILVSKDAMADEARDLARSLELIYALVSVLIACLFYLGAPFIAEHWLKLQHLPTGQVIAAIRLMGGCLAIQAPIGMYNGGLYGLDKQKSLNAAVVVLSIVRYGGGLLVLIIVAATPVYFFIWQLIFSLFQLAVLGTMFWHYLPTGTRPARFSRAALARVSKFTSGMFVVAIASFLVNQLDKFVLSSWLPLSSFGTYQLANQVNNGVRLLPGLIDSVVLPRLAVCSETGDEETLKTIYHEASQFVAFMTLPLAAVFIFFSVSVVELWIGSQTIANEAGPIASILVAGSAINGSLRVPYVLTLARGWAMYGVYESAITLVVFIPCLLLLASRWGATGAAAAWLCLNILWFAVAAPIIHFKMLRGEYVIWLARDVLVPMAVCVVVAAMSSLLKPSVLSKVWLLSYVAGTAVLCLVACLLVLPRVRSIAAFFARRSVQRLLVLAR